MTGPEHYREAERLLKGAANLTKPVAAHDLCGIQDRAQVHATLALAAATALGVSPGGGVDSGPHMPDEDAQAWQQVASGVAW